MSVKSCEKLEKSQVALTVEVGAEDFEAAVEKAYLKLRKKINVPGFRPGKAPRKIIEGMYGAEVFFEEAVDIAMPDAYEAAVKGEELNIVGYPQVELVGEVTKDGFTFKATVPVYPEVTLGQYKGLTAPKAEVEVAESDVDAKIKELSDRNTRLVSVERAVENGDIAVIDFEGFENGKAFEGGKGENYSLEIGSGSFVPGFEEQLIGMKADEEKEIDVTFPEDYHKDLAGKAVVFKVKVHEVKVKEVPALDDEFAKDVSEFDTLEQLRGDLKQKIAEERQKKADADFEDALMGQVADNITCDVPDAMVESQADHFLENMKLQLQRQGIAFDQYLKMTGMTEEALKLDAMEPSRKQVRLDLALSAIIKEEKLEASDEEVEEKYKKLAEQTGLELEMTKKYITAAQVKDQVVTDKAIAVVVDSAVATEAAEGAAETAEESDSSAEEKPKKKPAAKKTSAKKKEAAEPASEEASDKTEETV